MGVVSNALYVSWTLMYSTLSVHVKAMATMTLSAFELSFHISHMSLNVIIRGRVVVFIKKGSSRLMF